MKQRAKTDVEALAAKVQAMPTTTKLTAAVMLIQNGSLDVAETVIRLALGDLQAKRLLRIERVPLT